MGNSNPPNPSPATIDIDTLLDNFRVVDGTKNARTPTSKEELKALLTDLITEKENRARVDELQNLRIRISYQPVINKLARIQVYMCFDERIKELEATLKSKGRDNE